LKTLLIDPPYNRLMGIKMPCIYPLGLASLSAILNAAGHESTYVNLDYDDELVYANPFSRTKNISLYEKYLAECDNDINCNSWKELQDLLIRMSPEIVGISCVTVKMKSVLKITRIVKNYSPGTKVILGGHHSQIYANEILNNCADVDFVIKGEAEQTLLEVADALEKEKSGITGSYPEKSLRDIDGLVFRDSSGRVCENKPRALISDLDCLPNAESAKYYKNNELINLSLSSIMTSRGCPYQCSFCATNQIWHRKVRRRSVSNVIDELEYRIERDNIHEFNFLDDCFTINKDWITELCESLLSKNLSINFSCISSINFIDENLFKLIVRAGCNKINLGIESGSERILKLCNKKVDLNDAKKIFEYTRKYRISTTAYFMMGFPTETEEDIRKTQQCIHQLKPNWVYMNILIPLPGTKLFDWAVNEGLIDTRSAWSGDMYKNLQFNYTNTIDNELFNKLVDENYELCYKINKRIRNVLKRIPLKAYVKKPHKAVLDMKKFADWVRK